MTDTPPTDDTTPPEGEPDDADAPVDDQPDDEVARLRREAADRRVAAREATERADALDRALVDRVVASACADVMADPTDLVRYLDGPIPRDETTGLPDEAAVRAAAEAIVEARPHLAARRFARVPAGPQSDQADQPTTILGALRGAV